MTPVASSVRCFLLLQISDSNVAIPVGEGLAEEGKRRQFDVGETRLGLKSFLYARKMQTGMYVCFDKGTTCPFVDTRKMLKSWDEATGEKNH